MINSWYVSHPDSRNKISKPSRYCVSDKGCVEDDVVAATSCLSFLFREFRVAISVCVLVVMERGFVVDSTETSRFYSSRRVRIKFTWDD